MVRLHVTPLPQSSHLLVSLIDATGLARMRAELDASREETTYLVRHDALTGLPNRAHFLAQLQDKVNLAALTGSRVHVLSIKSSMKCVRSTSVLAFNPVMNSCVFSARTCAIPWAGNIFWVARGAGCFA